MRFPTFRTLLLLFSFLMFLGLAACAVDSDDDEDDSDDGGDSGTSDFFTLDARTDDDGVAAVDFEVPEGTTKLAVTAAYSSGQVAFDMLTDSKGRDFLTPGGEDISLSPYFASGVNTAIAPVRDSDPSLDDSLTYYCAVVAGTVSGSSFSAADNRTVRFTVQTKSDGNLRGGRLRINLVYVGELAQGDDVIDVVEPAVEAMQGIYSEEAGITASVSEFGIAGPTIVAAPYDGDDFYADASRTLPANAVSIFIVGDIEDSDGEILGMAGGIPGPPIASPRSGVAVSILGGAGPDGVFDNEEIKILGETLAHEAGHFLGLEHPIEFSGNSVTDVDALGDTDTCRSIAECSSNEDLRQNLMFPFPVADGDGGYYRQNQLTGEQRSLMNRYILVD